MKYETYDTIFNGSDEVLSLATRVVELMFADIVNNNGALAGEVAIPKINEKHGGWIAEILEERGWDYVTLQLKDDSYGKWYLVYKIKKKETSPSRWVKS